MQLPVQALDAAVSQVRPGLRAAAAAADARGAPAHAAGAAQGGGHPLRWRHHTPSGLSAQWLSWHYYQARGSGAVEEDALSRGLRARWGRSPLLLHVDVGMDVLRPLHAYALLLQDEPLEAARRCYLLFNGNIAAVGTRTCLPTVLHDGGGEASGLRGP